MSIAIHHKLKPFSHHKGSSYLIPGSGISLKVYPCLIEGFDLFLGQSLFTLKLELSEFYQDFLTEVDYEKRSLRVCGSHSCGFIEFKISRVDDQLQLTLLRFKGELAVELNGKALVLKAKESLILAQESVRTKQSVEKVDFGSSKKQDLVRIHQDKTLKECLPYLFCLGSSLDLEPLALIDLDSFYQKELKIELEKLLYGFFKEGFIPSLIDDQHMGLKGFAQGLSPLYLTHSVARWLKSNLAHYQGSCLVILRHLPRELIAGRATCLQFLFGTVHLEWTKGFIRRMILEITTPTTLELIFPKQVKSYRLRLGKKTLKNIQEFLPGIYHFDKFEA